MTSVNPALRHKRFQDFFTLYLETTIRVIARAISKVFHEDNALEVVWQDYLGEYDDEDGASPLLPYAQAVFRGLNALKKQTAPGEEPDLVAPIGNALGGMFPGRFLTDQEEFDMIKYVKDVVKRITHGSDATDPQPVNKSKPREVIVVSDSDEEEMEPVSSSSYASSSYAVAAAPAAVVPSMPTLTAAVAAVSVSIDPFYKPEKAEKQEPEQKREESEAPVAQQSLVFGVAPQDARSDNDDEALCSVPDANFSDAESSSGASSPSPSPAPAPSPMMEGKGDPFNPVGSDESQSSSEALSRLSVDDHKENPFALLQANLDQERSVDMDDEMKEAEAEVVEPRASSRVRRPNSRYTGGGKVGPSVPPPTTTTAARSSPKRKARNALAEEGKQKKQKQDDEEVAAPAATPSRHSGRVCHAPQLFGDWTQ
jgi:hypothetical protein